MKNINLNKMLNFYIYMIITLNLIPIIINNNFSLQYLILLIFFLTLFGNFNNPSPLMMNLSIICLTLITSMLINTLINTNWFSLINFMIMIGGMMILFMYFNSFLTNSNFNLESKYSNFNLIFKNFTFFFFIFINFNNFNLYEMFYINNYLKNFNILNTFQLMLFNLNPLILLFMILYLLLMLIIVTYLCLSKNYSLRKLN